MNSLVWKICYFKSYLTNYRFIIITPTSHLSNLQHLHLELQKSCAFKSDVHFLFISSTQHAINLGIIWLLRTFDECIFLFCRYWGMSISNHLVALPYSYIIIYTFSYLFFLVCKYSFICYYVATIGRENIIIYLLTWCLKLQH